MALNPDTFRSEGTNREQRQLLLQTQNYEPKTILLACQKVNDAYPFGVSSKTRILTPFGVPSDLDGDDTLDYDEASFTDTTTTTQLSLSYILQDLVSVRQYLIGDVRCTASMALKVSAGTVTVPTVTFTLLSMAEDDSTTTITTADATPNISSTSSTYADFDVQAYIQVPAESIIEVHERLVLKIEPKAFVDDSANTGTIRLYTARGSWDTYCEAYIGI